MAVARIAHDNDRARRIWHALGVQEYVIPELRGPGQPECLFTLLADDWQQSHFAR